MTPAGVGFAFSFLVLARELYARWRPWHERKQEARAECARHGHVWGEPFPAMGVLCRNCTRCKHQEHKGPDDEWS